MASKGDTSVKSVNGLIALAFAGVFVALLYVLWGNSFCEHKQRDTGEKQDEANCYAINGVKLSPCIPVRDGSDGANAPQAAKNGDEYKFGSWTADMLCEVKASDIAISLFTYGLVLVGVFQGFWLNRSVEVAKEAADAADVSAQAIAAGLKSEIFILDMEISDFEEFVFKAEAAFRAAITIVLSNHGGGRADISSVEANLFYLGKITYVDFVGEYEFGFVWKFDFRQRNFERSGWRETNQPKHNYQRQLRKFGSVSA